MIKIILNENQLNRLFEHHSQQRLPFMLQSLRVQDGTYGQMEVDNYFSKKNGMENFLDWIEEFGKVGELKGSSISFVDGINSGLDTAFKWYCERYDIDDVFKETERSSFIKMLSEYGFYDVKDDGSYTTKCVFNKVGNLYVERSIVLDNKLDDIVGDELYTNIIKNYQDNVGGCWCWKKGNSQAYCAKNGGSNIILRGWIRLDDIDWVETVYTNAYSMRHENEIRVKPNAKVELFDIVSVHEGKKFKFNLGGKHFIVSSTYFGNNGKYNNLGYAKIYDNNSNEILWRDRQGNLVKDNEVTNNILMSVKEKLSKLSLNDKNICKLFNVYYISLENKYSIIKECDKYFIIDRTNHEIVQNTYFDYCSKCFELNLFCVKKCNKYNFIDNNGEYYLDKWYDDFMTNDFKLYVYDDKIRKWGIYDGEKTKFINDIDDIDNDFEL
jgi:hypothetical protein